LITGEFPHTDVLLWMQRAKVFLHPSSYEGFGVVMLEALYAGCHVLSFCKPNKKEIDHWHIVASAKQMTEKAAALLLDPGIKYDNVTFRNINQAADEMMELFTANSDGI